MSNAPALIKKEFLQIIRDFSSLLIAFVLPLIILFLYRFAVNLDTVKITIGIKNDDINPKISTLINSFNHSDYIKTKHYDNKEKMYKDIYAKLEPHHSYVEEKIKNTDLAKMGELLKDLREILEDTIDIGI